MKVFRFLLLLICLNSCHEKEKKVSKLYHELHKKLNEISGLTTNSEGKLFALNDEDGKIFQINSADYSIVETINFKEKGDYEGLTIKGGLFYVLKSNGTVLKINRTGNILNKYEVQEQFKKFEFEGISYRAGTDELLIACKRTPTENLDSFINIYSFSFKKLALDALPVIQIRKSEKFKKFRASGIAVDSANLYIVSAKSAQLLIYNLENENIRTVIGFEADKLPQLEGVTLGGKEIIIVSEKADNKSAKLHRFTNH